MNDNSGISSHTIAIIGGTGALGSGLALRWAMAGHTIVLGSRDRARAVETAAELSGKIVSGTLSGADNPEARVGEKRT